MINETSLVTRERQGGGQGGGGYIYHQACIVTNLCMVWERNREGAGKRYCM